MIGTINTETSLKRYRYVGKERYKETGFYYYGARYYAAWLCRFVSADPLQFKYPHYTPFQYAGNKPISYIDLDGLEEKNTEKVDAISGPDYRIQKSSKFFTEINFNNPKKLEGEHLKISADIKFGPHTREGFRLLGYGTTYKVGLQQEIGSVEILINHDNRILNINLYNKDIEFQSEGSYFIFKGGIKTFIPKTNLMESCETDIYGDEYKIGVAFTDMTFDENGAANVNFELLELSKTIYSSPIGNLSFSFSLSIENVDLKGFSSTISESGKGLGSSYGQREAYRIMREYEIQKTKKQELLNSFIKK